MIHLDIIFDEHKFSSDTEPLRSILAVCCQDAGADLISQSLCKT